MEIKTLAATEPKIKLLLEILISPPPMIMRIIPISNDSHSHNIVYCIKINNYFYLSLK